MYLLRKVVSEKNCKFLKKIKLYFNFDSKERFKDKKYFESMIVLKSTSVKKDQTFSLTNMRELKFTIIYK